MHACLHACILKLSDAYITADSDVMRACMRALLTCLMPTSQLILMSCVHACVRY